MELRLPVDKVDKLNTVLAEVKDAKTISKKRLESFTGVLSHCSNLIKGGRIFCRRLYDLYKLMVTKQLRRMYIPKEAKLDIEWWLKFATVFNGVSAMRNPMFNDVMFTDSSMKGFGVCLGHRWLVGTWPHVQQLTFSSECGHKTNPPLESSIDYDNINLLELWPVLVGVRRWIHLFQNKTLYIYSDNTQVVAMLTNSVSSNRQYMQWIRDLFWELVSHNVQLHVNYISTSDNVVADTLSRLAYDSDIFGKKHVIANSGLCCADKLLNFLGRSDDNSTKIPTADEHVYNIIHKED